MLEQLLLESLRVCFLVGFPILLVAVFSGLLVGVLQSVTSVYEPALNYSVRVLAVGATLYVLAPTFLAELKRLIQLSMGVG